MTRNSTAKQARRPTPRVGTIGYRIDPEEAALVDKRAAAFRMSRHGYARLALRNDLHRHDFTEIRALLVGLDQKLTNASDLQQRELKALRCAVEDLTRAVTQLLSAVEPVEQ